MKLSDETPCLYSPACPDQLLDFFGLDGLTLYGRKTWEELVREHPDAQVATLGEHLRAKAARQDSPITWGATTRDEFCNKLECVFPADMAGGGFLVGEPYDHHALTGEPRFLAFRELSGDRYERASRPLTVAEFRREVTPAPLLAQP